MKRKIALALAAVVAIATIVPMNVFASSSSAATGMTITNYGSGYQFVDGQKGTNSSNTLANSITEAIGGNAASAGALGNNGYGTALTVSFTSSQSAVQAQTGQAIARTFQLTLTNAVWNFYGQNKLISGTTVNPYAANNTYGMELYPANNPYVTNYNPLTGGAGKQISANVNNASGVNAASGYQRYMATDSIMNNTALDIRALFDMTNAYGSAKVAGAAFSDGYSFTNTANITTAELNNLGLTIPAMDAGVLTGTPASNAYTNADMLTLIAYNKGLINTSGAVVTALTAANVADLVNTFYLDLYQMAQQRQSSTQATMPMTAADMAAYIGDFAPSGLAAAEDAAVNPVAPAVQDLTGIQAIYTAMIGSTASGDFNAVVPVTGTDGTINPDSTGLYQGYSPLSWNYYSYVGQNANTAYASNYQAVPYVIQMVNANTILVTYFGNINNIANSTSVLSVPICAISTATGAITATVTDASNNVTGQVVNLSSGGSTGCSMTVDQSGTVPANYRISLGTVTISENQQNTLHSGTFYIDAPVGYHFVNDGIAGGGTTTAINNASTANSYPVTVSMIPSLYQLSPTNMQVGGFAWRNYNGSSYDPMTGTFNSAVNPNVAPNSLTDYSTSTQFYPSTQNSRLYFTINVKNAGQYGYLGSITIAGLVIAQDDPSNTAYGQSLTMNINDAQSSALTGIGINENGGAGVNQVSFTSRMSFGLSYTLVNANPVNAYSGWRNMGDIQPWSTNLSQLSTNYGGVTTPVTVLFQENSPNSWWSSQDTTFTLTDANGNAMTDVKFSTVGIMTNNISNAIGNWSSPSYQSWTNNPAQYDQRYNVSGTSNVTFNAANNSIDVFDLSKSSATALGAVQLQFTLSANPGFTGDVYLTVANQGISSTTNINTTSIKIATFRSPITVTTTTTVAQIGYQSYNVADVSFTEDIPGLIQSGPYNNTVNMYLGEYGDGQQTPYMYFAPVTSSDISVTPANCGLSVSNLGITGNANSSATGTLTNNITFNINSSSYHPSSSTDTASYSAATITVSNLVVNIDRNVPQGDYQIIIGGSAITDNCPIPATSSTANAQGIMNPNGSAMDFFGVGGFVAPTTFITIGTSGSNVPFTTRVAVAAGSDTALVGPTDNQTSFAMGCQAFIDPNTNRMMVPIRFAVAALGVDPSQVLWDANSHTCTIYTAEKMLTFVQGQSTMYVNNQPFTLQNTDANGNPDGTYVMPNLYPASDGTYRLFIPFRALADAIGINVTWDGSTSTAVFNPTPDEWTAYQAAVAAATPAATAAVTPSPSAAS